VFLEVFVHGKWALLDATHLALQTDYDPRQRLLPGERYAYDKGGDPYALVLSPRWGLWKQQTAVYFRGFDLALLPVPLAGSLSAASGSTGGAGMTAPVFVVADGPYYQWMVDRCQALGIATGTSFNTDFDAQLARAAGHTLVVAMVGGRLVLPEKYWPEQTVISVPELRRRQQETARGIFYRRRGDGTDVYVLYGADGPALRQMVDEFPP
jgi:hypothetical protein